MSADGSTAAALSASLAVISPAAPRTRAPSSRHALVTASRSWRNPGNPPRGAGG
jgi:hypothetical protein